MQQNHRTAKQIRIDTNSYIKLIAAFCLSKFGEGKLLICGSDYDIKLSMELASACWLMQLNCHYEDVNIMN